MIGKLKFPWIFFSAFVFYFLFWRQSLGNNTAVYSIFIVVSGSLYSGLQQKRLGFYLVGLGVLVSSFYIAYHASILAIFVWIMSLILYQAFLHWDSFRTPFYAFLSSFIDYFSFINSFRSNTHSIGSLSFGGKRFWKWFKIALIPLFVFYIFYWIYKWAVPEFDKLSSSFFEKIVYWFHYVFADISFWAILFFIWGLITSAWFFYKRRKNTLLIEETKYRDKIFRNKNIVGFKFSRPINLKPSLKNEFRSALVLIISVNVLLFIVNLVDIKSIWLGFEYTSDFDLKQFVHEGTYLLILSILMSMSIMVYFFRRNLNFYPRKKVLQIASYVWIFQNFILLISVVIRNLHYIHYFGLAYLRIGLFFFLILVIFGLVTLVLKIKNKASLFYLFKLNSWAVYIGFVLFAAPDWDTIIAKNNLNHPMKNNMETSFLLTLDEKVFPLIDQSSDVLNQETKFNTYRQFDKTYTEFYHQKVKDFISDYKINSWLSRNYKDDKAYLYFTKSSSKE